MAKVEILAPFLLSFEGGFVNDKNDKGGATNKGVTLNTWRKVGYDKDNDGDIDVDDLKLITAEDAIYRVLKPYYWDAIRADEIKCQAVANIFADWAYNSGAATAAKKVQKILGVTIDGKIGPKSIAAINGVAYSTTLFNAIKNARMNFLQDIVRNNPSQQRFWNGWKRRVDSIQYHTLILNNGKYLNF